ncbi:MAG: hypothetical protein RLZZ52_1247, partial [Actinomycetota bacterium]
PSWVKDAPPKFSTFNARSEDAASKASWRDSVKSKRCLVPASGYYEWVLENRVKVPHYIHSDHTVAFAGLYAWWRLAAIHDRNPVPIPKSFWSTWLDPLVVGTQELVDAAVSEAQPVAAGFQEYRVNSLKGNSPELIVPARPAPSP